MSVLGVGHCTLDYIGVVERFVEPDFQREFDQFSTQGGGAAATAVVALSRWGVTTSFVGKVGDDARGSEIIRTLAEEGVDVSGMVRQPNGVSQMAMTVVESSSRRRQSYLTRGDISPMASEDVDSSVLDGVSILLCDGTHPDAEIPLMRAAVERGIRVVLDASRMTQQVAEAVSCADFLVASERFASQFAGVGELDSLCHALLERGPSTVVVTLGNEGCVAMERGGELFRESAYEVDVLDTTGAGDVFHGGIIYGVLEGWDLERTLKFANVAGGLACMGLGGRSSIAPVEEILSHI